MWLDNIGMKGVRALVCAGRRGISRETGIHRESSMPPDLANASKRAGHSLPHLGAVRTHTGRHYVEVKTGVSSCDELPHVMQPHRFDATTPTISYG